MNIRDIKVLLEKYYRGETSDKEEYDLRQFFLDGDVPDELTGEKEIFAFYSGSELVPEASPGFEKRIIEAVEKLDRGSERRKIRPLMLTLISAAAGLLLLVGSYFMFKNRSFEADTFTDPQLAYAETLRVLYEVSSKMNKGTQALEQVRRFREASSIGFAAVGKSAGTIDRSMENLDYFQKMLDIADSPFEMVKTK